MATWKKVLTSGSGAVLKSLSVGTVDVADAFSATPEANITASSKISALSDEGVLLGDMTKMVIVTSVNGINEFHHTESSALSADVKLLTYGAGISGSLKKEPGTGWSGSLEGTINVDTGSLTGIGLVGEPEGKITVLANPTTANIVVSETGVKVDATQLVNGATKKGLTVSSGQIIPFVDGTTTHINASGQLTASADIAFANALEEGNGIIDFSYNGTSGATIAFDASDLRGQGITTTNPGAVSNVLTINTGSGAAIEDTNSILIFAGSAFLTSSIKENESAKTITLGYADYTTSIPGALSVEGTATFENETDLEVADKFILLNSGSGTALTDTFGFVGQTGSFAADAGIGFAYDGAKRWIMTKQALGNGSAPPIGDIGTKVGSISLLVDSADVGTGDTFFNQNGNMLRQDADNFFIYAESA